MNREFLVLFLDKTRFPEAAKEAVLAAADQVANEIGAILSFYEAGYDHQATIPLIRELANSAGVHEYTLWMVLLCLAAEKARPLYKTEKIYWDTFCDLRYKAQECYEVHHIWGTFVAQWYPSFYHGSIVKLGRMEYQVKPCPFNEPKSALGVTINPGEPMIALHIPASLEPFDAAARVESYRMAWEYFCPDGRPLVCVCSSWLLFDGYEDLFTPGSNIADFRKEFYMLGNKKTEISDAWRIFGESHGLPPEQLPESTALQRAFKYYLMRGGEHGLGIGMIVFDGKKLLSARA